MEPPLALIPRPGALLDNSAIHQQSGRVSSDLASQAMLPHPLPQSWGQDRHLPTTCVPCWAPQLSDVHQDPGAEPPGGRCPLQGAQGPPAAGRRVGRAPATAAEAMTLLAICRSCCGYLRLRGLQLDERSGGLGDHFLQQVIIWAKSGTCQAQLTGSPFPLCPRPLLPGQPWHLGAAATLAAASLVDLETFSEQTVSSSGPFQGKFPQRPLFPPH